jgi:HEPN domain-containing protein
MNRRDLQDLARVRLAEARALLGNARFPGAYYLAGYAVECALKACISKQFGRHEFPDKKLVNDSYTHDLWKLIGVAGLRADFDATVAASPAFELNWAIVKDWSEEDRYNLSISEAEARDLYSAITSRRTGVMSWLRNHW